MRIACAAALVLAVTVTGCSRGSETRTSEYGAGGDRPPATGYSAQPAPAAGYSAQSVPTQTPAPADFNFIAQAAFGGLAEVQLGQLAAERSAALAVREFARTMVADHSQVNNELTALAPQLAVQPPTTTDPGRQETATLLAALSGTTFDRQYAAIQVAEHRVALALFESEASGGQDARLRDFAARHVPTLRQHLARAEQLMSPRLSSAR